MSPLPGGHIPQTACRRHRQPGHTWRPQLGPERTCDTGPGRLWQPGFETGISGHGSHVVWPEAPTGRKRLLPRLGAVGAQTRATRAAGEHTATVGDRSLRWECRVLTAAQSLGSGRPPLTLPRSSGEHESFSVSVAK